MALTDIEKENVRTAATNIDECAKAMDLIFDDLISTMNMVGNDEKVFAGAGKEGLMTNFNETKTNFDNYIINLKNFSATLSSLLTEAEAGEKQQAVKADSLPGNIG